MTVAEPTTFRRGHSTLDPHRTSPNLTAPNRVLPWAIAEATYRCGHPLLEMPIPTELPDEQATALGRLVDVYPMARELGERFTAAGHELALVGGTVRDTLLAGGAAIDEADLDFATSARPDETRGLLEGWADAVFPLGEKYGTISALKRRDDGPDRSIEITTYRADTYEAGSRHPTVSFGDSLVDDLARRDFTINALAVTMPGARFIDAFGGLTDLNNRILRTPIEPEVSFGDDPLRMVRLARFVAKLDASVDPSTLAAAEAMHGELTTISAERIRDELVKLMAADHPVAGLKLLVDSGMSAYVLPELDLLEECWDPIHRHKDVYAHTMAVLENVIELEPDEPDVVLRLAAVLHDVGKPETREIHGDQSVTFHHHDVVGARMVRHRLRALRFDNKTVKDVSELVRMHLRFHTYKMGWTDSAVRRYVTDAGHLLDQLNLLTRADVTTRNKRKARAIEARMDELELRIAEILEQEELDALRPAIDGNAIMAHTGMAPGRQVGQAWQWLLDLRLEAGAVDDEVAYAALDRWWAAVSAGDQPPSAGEVAAELGLA